MLQSHPVVLVTSRICIASKMSALVMSNFVELPTRLEISGRKKLLGGLKVEWKKLLNSSAIL